MREKLTRQVRYGPMNFTVHEYNAVTVEDMLAHKSREVLFHLKTRKKWACSVVESEIRRDLVRSNLNA